MTPHSPGACCARPGAIRSNASGVQIPPRGGTRPSIMTDPGKQKRRSAEADRLESLPSAYSTLRKYRFPVPDAGATYGLAAPDTFENGPVIEVADWSVPV